MHYFEKEEMQAILSSRGFSQTESFENILPAKDVWDGENVTWAYPVTTDQTPHHVTFSSGEEVHAA